MYLLCSKILRNARLRRRSEFRPLRDKLLVPDYVSLDYRDCKNSVTCRNLLVSLSSDTSIVAWRATVALRAPQRRWEGYITLGEEKLHLVFFSNLLMALTAFE
jgi:hypothetical protein